MAPRGRSAHVLQVVSMSVYNCLHLTLNDLFDCTAFVFMGPSLPEKYVGPPISPRSMRARYLPRRMRGPLPPETYAGPLPPREVRRASYLPKKYAGPLPPEKYVGPLPPQEGAGLLPTDLYIWIACGICSHCLVCY